MAAVGLVTDDAQNVGLAAVVIERVTHRLTVDGEAVIGVGVLGVPALQGAVQVHRIDPHQQVAQDRATGDLVALVAIAAAKARPRFLP